MSDNTTDRDALLAGASQETDPLKQYEDRMGANREFYEGVAAAREDWTKLSEHRQPAYTGVPYFVPAGGAVTLRQTDGPQINDLMFVNAHDLDEYAALDCTIQVERSYHVQTFSRAWSCVPYMRPLVTVVDDGADYDDRESLRTDSTKWHFWAPHCTSELIEAASGVANHPSCQTMFEMAWRELGIGADDLRTKMPDLNVFQPNDMAQTDDDGFMLGTLYPGRTHHQHITFYAEIDIYILVIMCPFGNQEKPILEATCWPTTVEIHDTGIAPDANPKYHTTTWNLRENEAPAGAGLPAPADRWPGVNSLENPMA
ncbi:MAG: DUF1989 domain-containing protein [Actinomycetota bacterium]